MAVWRACRQQPAASSPRGHAPRAEKAEAEQQRAPAGQRGGERAAPAPRPRQVGGQSAGGRGGESAAPAEAGRGGWGVAAFAPPWLRPRPAPPPSPRAAAVNQGRVSRARAERGAATPQPSGGHSRKKRQSLCQLQPPPSHRGRAGPASPPASPPPPPTSIPVSQRGFVLLMRDERYVFSTPLGLLHRLPSSLPPRPCSLPPPPGPPRCWKGRRRGREGTRGREGGLCFVLMSELEQPPSGCCSGAYGSGFKPRFVRAPSSLPSFSPTLCRCARISGLRRLMFRRREGEEGRRTNNNNPNNLLSCVLVVVGVVADQKKEEEEEAAAAMATEGGKTSEPENNNKKPKTSGSQVKANAKRKFNTKL